MHVGSWREYHRTDVHGTCTEQHARTALLQVVQAHLLVRDAATIVALIGQAFQDGNLLRQPMCFRFFFSTSNLLAACFKSRKLDKQVATGTSLQVRSYCHNVRAIEMNRHVLMPKRCF